MRRFWHIAYYSSAIIVILAGVLAFLGAYVAGELEQDATVLFVIAGVLFVVSIALPIYINTVALKPTKEEQAKMNEYLSLPVNENIDYKAQLDEIRNNFRSDETPGKNTFKIGRLPYPVQPLADFSVIRRGEIYYACIFFMSMALEMGRGATVNDTYLANVVYSTDPYFETDPLKLNSIAEKLFGRLHGRLPNVLRSGSFPIYTQEPVDEKFTDGKEVFVGSMEVYLPQLPLMKVTNRIAPIIAAPEACEAAFLVDCKYWTDEFIADFVNGKQGNKTNR